MADVRAFRGLRYDERLSGALTDLLCPPYDVISDDERRRLLGRSERNFVRIELPDPDARGYAAAAELLGRWRAEGALVADAPAIYVHEHAFTLGGARAVRRGVFLALRTHDGDEGVVLPHEHTFPKAKAERLDLLRATRTNTSAVFGMVDGAAMGVIADAAAEPAGDADLGGDRHTLRRVLDTERTAAFRDALRTEPVYIADGHHRFETARTYANERSAPAGANERYVLTYLCALEDPGLRILATHRVVHGASAALDAAVARSFDASPVDRGALGDIQPGIVLVRDGRFTRLEPRPDADLSRLPPAWRALPVAIAEALLLQTARDAGAEVGYEHDTDRAIDAARGGASAVLLRAVDPLTLRAVADAGERLPQKTTYFYPKVPAGLVMRSLDLG